MDNKTFIGALAMNIKIIQVINNINAEDKSDGMINTITKKMGIDNSSTEIVLLCMIDKVLATYMIKAIFAKSDVWNVMPIKGIRIHRVA